MVENSVSDEFFVASSTSLCSSRQIMLAGSRITTLDVGGLDISFATNPVAHEAWHELQFSGLRWVTLLRPSHLSRVDHCEGPLLSEPENNVAKVGHVTGNDVGAPVFAERFGTFWCHTTPGNVPATPSPRVSRPRREIAIDIDIDASAPSTLFTVALSLLALECFPTRVGRTTLLLT